MPVKTLKSFLNEDIAKETLERTELLVDSLYSVYIDEFDKNLLPNYIKNNFEKFKDWLV